MTYKQQAEELVRERLGLKGVDSGRPTGSNYIDYPEILLNHWLRVLSPIMNITLEYNWNGMSLYGGQSFMDRIEFDPITGQPKSEEDYEKVVKLIK